MTQIEKCKFQLFRYIETREIVPLLLTFRDYWLGSMKRLDHAIPLRISPISNELLRNLVMKTIRIQPQCEISRRPSPASPSMHRGEKKEREKGEMTAKKTKNK